MNNLVLVWAESKSNPGPANPPTISVSAWAAALGLPWQRWNTKYIDTMPTSVREARVAIVNVFHTDDSLHVQQIKSVNPDCYVVACPDASLDMVLMHPEWPHFWQQLAAADAIGGRTHTDCTFYGNMLQKPAFWLPTCIGPTGWFEPYRDLPRGDYVLSLDHGFAPPNTAANVTALAHLQRQTGCKVVYVAERNWTPRYAQLAGLVADFRGHVDFTDMVDLTARASLCVDMYASHAIGRQAILCAMVGTPCVTSDWCEKIDLLGIDLYDSRATADFAQAVPHWHRPHYGYQHVEQNYSFVAFRRHVDGMLTRIGVAVEN